MCSKESKNLESISTELGLIKKCDSRVLFKSSTDPTLFTEVAIMCMGVTEWSDGLRSFTIKAVAMKEGLVPEVVVYGSESYKVVFPKLKLYQRDTTDSVWKVVPFPDFRYVICCKPKKLSDGYLVESGSIVEIQLGLYGVDELKGVNYKLVDEAIELEFPTRYKLPLPPAEEKKLEEPTKSISTI